MIWIPVDELKRFEPTEKHFSFHGHNQKKPTASQTRQNRKETKDQMRKKLETNKEKSTNRDEKKERATDSLERKGGTV